MAITALKFKLKSNKGKGGPGRLIYPKGNVIYKITNTVNNKVYVGQTKWFKKRFGEHLKALLSNSHCNIHLQGSVNKYGKDNFIVEIIEFVEDLKELTAREQYWVDYYKSYDECNGYNLCKDVRNPWYGERSEEHKCKLSLAHLGKKASAEVRKRMSQAQLGLVKKGRSVSQYNMDLSLVNEYISVLEASRKSGVGATSIHKAADNKWKQAGGFIWKYKNK